MENSSKYYYQQSKKLVIIRENLENQMLNQPSAVGVQSPPQIAPINTSGVAIHSVLYAFQLLSEIKSMSHQYKTNKYEVFYFSKAASNCQLFLEFFWEILNEQSEPMILFIEGIKAFLKLKEYHKLTTKEKVNTYIEQETYHQIKREKEIKDGQIILTRTKKIYPKLKNFKKSPKLIALQAQQLAESKKKLQGSDQHPQEDQNNIDGLRNDLSTDEEQGNPREQRLSNIQKGLKWVSCILKTISNWLKNNRYHYDDILNIIRPVIYVYSVMMHGRKSYTPIKVSITIDMIAIIITISRLIKASSQQFKSPSDQTRKDKASMLRSIEKKELVRRIQKSALLYLIREPIFSVYTKPTIYRIFKTLRIPDTLFNLLISLLSYFRYYTYIA